MHGPWDLRRLPDTGVVTVREISLLVLDCVSTLCSARDRVARKTETEPKKEKKLFAPDAERRVRANSLPALSKLRKTGSFDKDIRTSTIPRHRPHHLLSTLRHYGRRPSTSWDWEGIY
jgi:hypothetical protein